MNIYIKKKEDIENKVIASQIHGKYPYKTYLEIKGNNKYGQYIVVVSNRDLHDGEDITSICIKLKNVKKKKKSNNGIVRPNSVNGEDSIYYNVREVNFINVQNEEMVVFTDVGKTLLIEKTAEDN